MALCLIEQLVSWRPVKGSVIRPIFVFSVSCPFTKITHPLGGFPAPLCRTAAAAVAPYRGWTETQLNVVQSSACAGGSGECFNQTWNGPGLGVDSTSWRKRRFHKSIEYEEGSFNPYLMRNIGSYWPETWWQHPSLPWKLLSSHQAEE